LDRKSLRERSVAESGRNDSGTAESPDVTKSDGRHSARRINRVARHTGAQSYLEIGVCRGATFNRVSINRKVGVDPNFRFNVEDSRKEGAELHLLTSDQYFTEVGGSKKFDIIFLDGLHQFHQTFRDFCNSLVCAHERTVWLIDDVFPVDVYSSLPIQRESIRFRRRERNDSNPAWHGDIYKLVFAIHDFFPTMSYVTLMGAGNPQTIAWKAPRKNFAPLLNSMEAIERLGYFDMLNREDIFNALSENEAFECFFASMPGFFSGSPSPAVAPAV
jgi:hypothetical protein